MGSLALWAPGALNQGLWGWKPLIEDWESVGCVASQVAETVTGWFFNSSAAIKNFPARTKHLPSTCQQLACDDNNPPAPRFCCRCVFLRQDSV